MRSTKTITDIEEERFNLVWQPSAVREIVARIRLLLRNDYPFINEVSDSEVIHFAAELWYPKI